MLGDGFLFTPTLGCMETQRMGPDSKELINFAESEKEQGSKQLMVVKPLMIDFKIQAE